MTDLDFQGVDEARTALWDAAVLCDLVRDFANHDDLRCWGETCAYCHQLGTREKIKVAMDVLGMEWS